MPPPKIIRMVTALNGGEAYSGPSQVKILPHLALDRSRARRPSDCSPQQGLPAPPNLILSFCSSCSPERLTPHWGLQCCEGRGREGAQLFSGCSLGPEANPDELRGGGKESRMACDPLSSPPRLHPSVP